MSSNYLWSACTNPGAGAVGQGNNSRQCCTGCARAYRIEKKSRVLSTDSSCYRDVPRFIYHSRFGGAFILIMTQSGNFWLEEANGVNRRKIPFFCSISKGSLCPSYSTTVIYWSTSQPHYLFSFFKE